MGSWSAHPPGPPPRGRSGAPPGTAPAGPTGQRAAPVGVRAEGWGWRYATRRAWALRDLDLQIDPGERVLLLGPSGSGKSTLLTGLAGLLDPSADGSGQQRGRLLLDGVPARRARAEGVRAGTARSGLLLQDPLAQTVLARCGDDVAFGLENHGVPVPDIWPRVAEALRGVGFGHPLDHSTSALSGGERQRLALAGVLALRPGLLLLDEPTAMLDPDGARALREQMRRVLENTGATCVLVEHRVRPWLDLVDRVAVLDPAGGVSADGTPEEVFGPAGTGSVGARLAAAGVWVPGWEPRRPPAARQGPGGETLLRARGLAVGLPGRRRPGTAPVVRGVDLSVGAGTARCLLGPNGSGKSTLLRALGGLVPPWGGTLTATPALADGVGPQPHRWRPRELVRRIGTVFQEPQHQFVATTVEEELAVGPRRTGLTGPPLRDRVAELLERLRLTGLAAANPFTLSGGEQRRLSVATALATRPRVLVLDEPTFGQDSRTWTELVDLLADLLDEGAAVVAATHDEALVTALGAQPLRLRDGAPQLPDPVLAGGPR